MVDYTTIDQTLTSLNNEYNNSSDTNFQTLLSKLAMLEFCGWIEVSIDEILREYLKKKTLDQSILNTTNEKIHSNWGFHFSSNIQPLFCYVIGVVNWQKVLSDLDAINKKEILISTLNNFTKKRGIAAHTNIQVTHSYDAPSSVQKKFQKYN